MHAPHKVLSFLISLNINILFWSINNMDLQSLLRGQLGALGQMGDMPLNDTAEQIQISSLALLKMLKHGKLFLIL